MTADDVDDVHVGAALIGAWPIVICHDVVRGIVDVAALAVVAPARVIGAQGIDHQVHELPIAAATLSRVLQRARIRPCHRLDNCEHVR